MEDSGTIQGTNQSLFKTCPSDWSWETGEELLEKREETFFCLFNETPK